MCLMPPLHILPLAYLITIPSSHVTPYLILPPLEYPMSEDEVKPLVFPRTSCTTDLAPRLFLGL